MSMQISWLSASQHIPGSERSIPRPTAWRTIPLARCSRSTRALLIVGCDQNRASSELLLVHLLSEAFHHIRQDRRAIVLHPQERQAHLNPAIAYRPKCHTPTDKNLNRGWKNRNAESGGNQAESCLHCGDFLHSLWLKARVGACRH